MFAALHPHAQMCGSPSLKQEVGFGLYCLTLTVAVSHTKSKNATQINTKSVALPTGSRAIRKFASLLMCADSAD